MRTVAIGFRLLRRWWLFRNFNLTGYYFILPQGGGLIGRGDSMGEGLIGGFTVRTFTPRFPEAPERGGRDGWQAKFARDIFEIRRYAVEMLRNSITTEEIGTACYQNSLAWHFYSILDMIISIRPNFTLRPQFTLGTVINRKMFGQSNVPSRNLSSYCLKVGQSTSELLRRVVKQSTVIWAVRKVISCTESQSELSELFPIYSWFLLGRSWKEARPTTAAPCATLRLSTRTRRRRTCFCTWNRPGTPVRSAMASWPNRRRRDILPRLCIRAFILW